VGVARAGAAEASSEASEASEAEAAEAAEAVEAVGAAGAGGGGGRGRGRDSWGTGSVATSGDSSSEASLDGEQAKRHPDHRGEPRRSPRCLVKKGSFAQHTNTYNAISIKREGQHLAHVTLTHIETTHTHTLTSQPRS
jgi:hypothetical protein